MSIVSSHHHICQPLIIYEGCGIGTISKVACSRYCGPCFSGRLVFFSHKLSLKGTCGKTARRKFSRICSVVDDGMNPDNSDEEDQESLDDKTKRVCYVLENQKGIYITISFVNPSHFSLYDLSLSHDVSFRHWSDATET